ncbi:hypothetical protein GCM10010387_02210 [Streptomyces inusitatus]|uniref:Lipoprotein n=1 Tax=Streptomyces inusitatus TaxID=68221 RepID=A0A918PLF5_9ACTN|nr:hypothetical protein [Streptomyces inusitatus]GGZ13721.1 hypothetical protein GCM10010387_02210 [Streptomyces inusitatus]
MKKTAALAALMVATSLSLTSCSGESEKEALHKIEADYASYDTVAGLTQAAEGAFQVKIGPVVGRECDDGGDAKGHGGPPTDSPEEGPEDDPVTSPPPSPPAGMEGGDSPHAACLPMVFHKATIETVILNPTPVTPLGTNPIPLGELIIGNVDTEAVQMDGASPIVPGTHMVVYADKLNSTEHPGINVVSGDLWVPVGGDQGLLDVAPGGAVSARSSSIKSLTETSPASRSSRFTTDIDALKKVARAKS